VLTRRTLEDRVKDEDHWPAVRGVSLVMGAEDLEDSSRAGDLLPFSVSPVVTLRCVPFMDCTVFWAMQQLSLYGERRVSQRRLTSGSNGGQGPYAYVSAEAARDLHGLLLLAY
jgi:hypothetical protein